MADDAESVVAGGHDAGQVDGADFEVFGDWDRLLGDGGGRIPGMTMLLVGFQDVGRCRICR